MINKTKKNTVNRNNKTKKQHNNLKVCHIGLKPFELEYGKSKGVQFFKKTPETKKREFVKKLLRQFAPNSIKPENDFYDYINYQWLKNITVEEQQKYIVQIDDFRLVQDKVCLLYTSDAADE